MDFMKLAPPKSRPSPSGHTESVVVFVGETSPAEAPSRPVVVPAELVVAAVVRQATCGRRSCGER